ncbi:MAG: hypothetical protein E7259_00025 [Lachnospiraceae bacterium]|nr:hypothetical protein [Lachnospiraceae bacterium]
MPDNEKLLNEIKKMQGGDFSSYEDFYYMTSPFVYDILINSVKNKGAADSLIVKVYNEVYQRIGEVTDVDFFYKWIETITKNAAKAHINSLIPETIEASGVQKNANIPINVATQENNFVQGNNMVQGATPVAQVKEKKSLPLAVKIIIGVLIVAILAVVGVVIAKNIGDKNDKSKNDETDVASETDSTPTDVTTEATTEVTTEEPTTEVTTEATTEEPTTEQSPYENLSETERLYYTYISETLLTQDKLSDISYRESSVCGEDLLIPDIERLLDGTEGIISAKIIDLNRDSLEELLIVRTEPAEEAGSYAVIMDVYGITDGQVNLISTEDKLYYSQQNGHTVFTMDSVTYTQFMDISVVNTDENTYIMFELQLYSIFSDTEGRVIHLYKLVDNDIKKVCRYGRGNEVNYGWTFAEDESGTYEDFYNPDDLETDMMTPFLARFGVDMDKYTNDDAYTEDVVSYDIDAIEVSGRYKMNYTVVDYTNLRDIIVR